MNADPLENRLEKGLRKLAVPLPAADRQRLLVFVRLLAKWNAAYNLTAVRDPEEMVTRHLLDSLVLLPYLHGSRVLDIGTGPGLPGIPLAVARPDCAFTLLDANAKKTRFVTQAVGELGLKNVDVVQERVENYRPEQKFDTLVARAFSSIADMLKSAQHLCAPGGRFLAMKGVYPEQELAAIPADYAVSEVAALKVPGLDAARHLAIITLRS
ncbi:MAG: 16S rRNA (guanine(527)-N(7))-methyltransferase RsmG [Pseudomonadota bacterium]